MGHGQWVPLLVPEGASCCLSSSLLLLQECRSHEGPVPPNTYLARRRWGSLPSLSGAEEGQELTRHPLSTTSVQCLGQSWPLPAAFQGFYQPQMHPVSALVPQDLWDGHHAWSALVRGSCFKYLKKTLLFFLYLFIWQNVSIHILKLELYNVLTHKRIKRVVSIEKNAVYHLIISAHSQTGCLPVLPDQPPSSSQHPAQAVRSQKAL